MPDSFILALPGQRGVFIQVCFSTGNPDLLPGSNKPHIVSASCCSSMPTRPPVNRGQGDGGSWPGGLNIAQCNP